ncbi:acetylornithine/N-succinyldiaminopimelate aminotransferase [Clostridium cavendishii DSM 21758]|uniref:Acetylornithine aminotransferase n=1 Tax=Clostridium cavendishii DSM 21758 TaxID=1121302 RepID=A0A1M6EPD9_9CLOT|nr:aspartate aminotransferase family protein [Clostridium cavendishii]SHI87357.1 acetylornithine/N-succinyldiaminopimelate aminotransferase [Clostridium cavendishii DSM 21758]
MTYKNDYLMDTYDFLDLTLVKGEGCYLYDSNGNKYLDFTSGIGVSSLGYGDKKLCKDLNAQISKLIHSSNIFKNETLLEVSKLLVEISEMSKVFFSNSGAESNEGAIKLARKYSFLNYGYGRNKVLSLKQSFHGRTMLTLRATGQEKFHKYFFPFPEGFDYVERNNIEDFKNKVDDSVCAILLESIQGEGGVNPLTEEFVTFISNYCEEKDILMIFDEVQTGIGRTGKLFGFQYFNVRPDIITLAKGLGAGLPIGAVLCNEKLSNVFQKGDHGSTFGGNILSLTGAKVVLERMKEDDFLPSVVEKGEVLYEALKNFYSELVIGVRGRGLMIGVEVKMPAKIVQQKALEKGLLVLTAGENVIRLLPPLVISKEEILKGVNILKKSIIEIGG